VKHESKEASSLVRVSQNLSSCRSLHLWQVFPILHSRKSSVDPAVFRAFAQAIVRLQTNRHRPGFSRQIPIRFVLFIPGYVALEALFPKGQELDGIERLALSVGLSLAMVPLVGLLLNYTPWGIRLDLIMISLTMLTVGLALVAFARRFRLSVERFELRELS